MDPFHLQMDEFQGQRNSTKEVDQTKEISPAQTAPSTTPSLMDLPIELLLRIISFLTRESIRNLMVNRTLHQICEGCIYRQISLYNQPRRSLRLLETFVQRPDLAQLVYHLSIDLRWVDERFFPRSEVPLSLMPDGMDALSLAKNVRSFSDSGVSDWIWEPSRARFRDTIFKFKLWRLEIPSLRDPSVHYTCGVGFDDDWDGDLGAEIIKLLQAQPLLEDLSCNMESSIKNHIRSSDIPSLRCFTGSPYLAIAFFPGGSRLESLNLTLTDWSEQLCYKMETSSKGIAQSIRHFTIRVWCDDDWLWSNLSRFFGLFPNMQNLVVAINALTSDTDVEHANHYFDKVARNVCVLPLLQNIEVRYETLNPETPRILEVDQKLLVAFKASCPLLENITTPKGEVWALSQTLNGREIPRLIGRVDHRRKRAEKDLPSPYEDEESPRDSDETD